LTQFCRSSHHYDQLYDIAGYLNTGTPAGRLQINDADERFVSLVFTKPVQIPCHSAEAPETTLTEASPAKAFDQLELALLDELFPSPATRGNGNHRPVRHYILCLARLGGYLARARDPDPGNIVIWRGLSRLNDLTLGYALGCRNVGN
jgi:hypothetical protein